MSSNPDLVPCITSFITPTKLLGLPNFQTWNPSISDPISIYSNICSSIIPPPHCLPVFLLLYALLCYVSFCTSITPDLTPFASPLPLTYSCVLCSIYKTPIHVCIRHLEYQLKKTLSTQCLCFWLPNPDFHASRNILALIPTLHSSPIKAILNFQISRLWKLNSAFPNSCMKYSNTE